jgi:hypothetical protein
LSHFNQEQESKVIKGALTHYNKSAELPLAPQSDQLTRTIAVQEAPGENRASDMPFSEHLITRTFSFTTY